MCMFGTENENVKKRVDEMGLAAELFTEYQPREV